MAFTMLEKPLLWLFVLVGVGVISHDASGMASGMYGGTAPSLMSSLRFTSLRFTRLSPKAIQQQPVMRKTAIEAGGIGSVGVGVGSGIRRRGCARETKSYADARDPQDMGSFMRKRDLMSGVMSSFALSGLTLASSTISSMVSPEMAKAEESAVASSSAGAGAVDYLDDKELFGIKVPKAWLVGKTNLTDGLGTSVAYSRNVVGFVPPGATEKTNVNVVTSPVAFDFKNMGSFGSPDSFGIKLVNLVDRKFGKNAKKNVATAKLIDAYSVGDIYYAEYETKEDYDEELGDYQTKLRFFVANAIRMPGRLNKMYSATGVCDMRDMDKYYSDIVQAVKSFKPPKNG